MRGTGLDGGAAVLRLRRVHIRRFRSVAPDTKLEFGPGAVFLLGRNGSGKSTLLDLLGCLISCDFSELRHEDEPVDVEWELVGPAGRGDGVLELHLVADTATSSQPVESVDDSEAVTRRPRPWQWSLNGVARMKPFEPSDDSFRFQLGSHTFINVTAIDGTSGATEIRVSLSPFEPSFVLNLVQALLGQASTRLFGFRLERMTQHLGEAVFRFDEALAVFNAITGDGESPLPLATISVKDDLFASIFVPWQASVARRRKDGVDIPAAVMPSTGRSDRDEDASLQTAIARMLGAEAVEVRPRLSRQRRTGTGVYRGFDIFVDWSGGARHRHDNLSFGQKRLAAFLWYQAVYEQVPILVDELTNGMHDEWVRRIIELLDGQQAFHAIQNPLLLNRSGLGQEDEIPRDFVFCSVDATESGRVWRWRNPTRDEAAEVRKAWTIGFQQLSDILLSRGLW